MVDGMRSVTGVIARQRSQVDAIAALSTEYLEVFEANRAFIFDLLRQTDIVLSTYNNTHVGGFNEAYARLGRILMSIQPLEAYYLDHSDQVVAAINQFRQIAETRRTRWTGRRQADRAARSAGGLARSRGGDQGTQRRDRARLRYLYPGRRRKC